MPPLIPAPGSARPRTPAGDPGLQTAALCWTGLDPRFYGDERVIGMVEISLILIGRVAGAFGVRGEVRITAFGDDPNGAPRLSRSEA